MRLLTHDDSVTHKKNTRDKHFFFVLLFIGVDSMYFCHNKSNIAVKEVDSERARGFCIDFAQIPQTT